MGSMTGAPKLKSTEIIEDFEESKRRFPHAQSPQRDNKQPCDPRHEGLEPRHKPDRLGGLHIANATALNRADVSCELRIYTGAFHASWNFVAEHPMSQRPLPRRHALVLASPSNQGG
eukprot:scaffold45555_cov52-Attheya_sp.AAC.7